MLVPEASHPSDRAVAPRALQHFSSIGVCHSALPVFDGLIRKRPLAIQNEGESPAFVTCAFTTPNFGSNPVSVSIRARSNDSVAHIVSCTAVTGTATGNTQAVTKTVELPAIGSQHSGSWVPTDFTGTTTTFPSSLSSVSCVLPPGSGLNDTYMASNLNVGG